MKSQTISLAWAPWVPFFILSSSGWPVLGICRVDGVCSLAMTTLSRAYTEAEESSETLCKYFGHSVAAVLYHLRATAAPFSVTLEAVGYGGQRGPTVTQDLLLARLHVWPPVLAVHAGPVCSLRLPSVRIPSWKEGIEPLLLFFFYLQSPQIWQACYVFRPPHPGTGTWVGLYSHSLSNV